VGIIVQCRGRSVWEPSLEVGYCFVAQVRALENLIGTDSGIGSIESDEVNVDEQTLVDFIDKTLMRLENTNNGSLFMRVVGCLQIMYRLAESYYRLMASGLRQVGSDCKRSETSANTRMEFHGYSSFRR